MEEIKNRIYNYISNELNDFEWQHKFMCGLGCARFNVTKALLTSLSQNLRRIGR